MEEKQEPIDMMKKVKEQVLDVKETMQYYMAKNPLVTLKLFYFFALSSFSLKVVYMPLYFKQVGLPASYAGVLAGLPPFIRGGGAFFLGVLADRMKKRRTLFLISLFANIIIPLLCLIPRIEYPVCDIDLTEEPVTDPLGMPLGFGQVKESVKTFLPHTIIDIERNNSRPSSVIQVVYYQSNGSLAKNQHPMYEENYVLRKRERRSTIRDLVQGKDMKEKLGIFEFYRRASGRRSEIPGKREQSKMVNEDNDADVKTKGKTVLKPRKKTPQESHEMLVTIFLTLLILLIIGEFLGGPLRSLADMCVLETMGGDKTNYGDVALWMQVGKIFLAPTILVLIRSFPLRICNTVKDDYEYSLYPLAAFSLFSLIFGFNIKFKGDYDDEFETKGKDDPDQDKTLFDVILTFKTFTILVLSFFAGGLSAVHYTFIFWYLTDLSPKDSAVVIAVVIVLRDIVSSISYKLSGRALQFFGPINTLHVALLLYIISFLSYAVMTNPWFAIIPEIVQYIVFPLAYSSFVVYLGNNTPAHLNATVQGKLQLLTYFDGPFLILTRLADNVM